MIEFILLVVVPWLTLGYLGTTIYLFIKNKREICYLNKNLKVRRAACWHHGINAAKYLIEVYNKKIKKDIDSIFLSLILVLINLLIIVIYFET